MVIGVIKFLALLAICLVFMLMQVSDITNTAFIPRLGYFSCLSGIFAYIFRVHASPEEWCPLET
jgi:hypothetical protein